jgi:hypothetical protein
MTTPGNDVNSEVNMLRAIRERRFRVLGVPYHELFHLLKSVAPCLRNLEMLDASLDQTRQMWAIRAAHPKFQVVADGEMLPQMLLEVTGRSSNTLAEDKADFYLDLEDPALIRSRLQGVIASLELLMEHPIFNQDAQSTLGALLRCIIRDARGLPVTDREWPGDSMVTTAPASTSPESA